MTSRRAHVLALLVALAGCGGSEPAPEPAPEPTPASAPEPGPGPAAPVDTTAAPADEALPAGGGRLQGARLSVHGYLATLPDTMRGLRRLVVVAGAPESEAADWGAADREATLALARAWGAALRDEGLAAEVVAVVPGDRQASLHAELAERRADGVLFVSASPPRDAGAMQVSGWRSSLFKVVRRGDHVELVTPGG